MISSLHFSTQNRIFSHLVQFSARLRGRLSALGHHESSVHRNPYESHSAYDAIRTQDADLAVSLLTIIRPHENRNS